jgi:hypothetical protein
MTPTTVAVRELEETLDTGGSTDSGGFDKASARNTAIDRIVTETRCSSGDADATLSWIETFLDRARDGDYCTVFPTDTEMAGKQYRIFNQVIPHGVTAAAPGSAHEAIGTALLDPSRDELTLVHEQTDAFPHYCTVRVSLGVFRA